MQPFGRPWARRRRPQPPLAAALLLLLGLAARVAAQGKQVQPLMRSKYSTAACELPSCAAAAATATATPSGSGTWTAFPLP